MELETRGTPIPSVRTRGMEEAGETAFAFLDALWGAPVGIAFLDRELRVLQVNEAFARLVGMPARALQGRSVRDIFGGDEPLADAAEERLRAVIESQRPVVDAPASSRAASGAVRTWRASAYPVFVPGRGVRGICAILDETTEVRDRMLALEQARAEADRSARRLGLLQAITAALSAAVELADVGAAVVERILAAVGADAVYLRTLEPEGLVVLASAGASPTAACGARVLPLDRPLPVTDAVRWVQALWIESPEVLAARYPGVARGPTSEGCGACVSIPLTARERVLGVLTLMFGEPRAFDLEERAFVLGIAAQCAQALDRARLFDAERRALAAARTAAEQVRGLQAVTAALSRAQTPRDVAEVVVEQGRAVLGADLATVHFGSADGTELTLAARGGALDADARRDAAVPRDAPLPEAAAFRTGEATWLESRDAVADAYAAEPDARRGGVLAAACLPLRASGNVLGVFAFAFTGPVRIDATARELALSIGDQCGQALERARLFEAVRVERDEAERARALLDDFVETAPLGVAMLDRDLRYVRINRVLACINGVPPEAHLGKRPIDIIPALPWDEVRGALRAVLETGEPRLDFALSTALPGDPGRIRHFVESWYPVRSGGEVAGIGVLVHETTAERDAEEFQRHVIGVVGHDLRNPLGAVKAAADMLARGDPLTERQARLVARVAAGVARMDQIVAVLLDYTQAQGGRGVPIRRRAVDLAALCRAVADECEAARPGRTVECSGEGDGAGDWDPDRLGQALSNLVSNALDYSPPDSAVKVHWRCAADEAEVDVVNLNAGAPIPPDTLARLFEPFRAGRRDRPGGKRGLGLGLFIANAVVSAHGGRIDVRSDARGTAFTMRLPRRPACVGAGAPTRAAGW